MQPGVATRREQQSPGLVRRGCLPDGREPTGNRRTLHRTIVLSICRSASVLAWMVFPGVSGTGGGPIAILTAASRTRLLQRWGRRPTTLPASGDNMLVSRRCVAPKSFLRSSLLSPRHWLLWLAARPAPTLARSPVAWRCIIRRTVLCLRPAIATAIIKHHLLAAAMSLRRITLLIMDSRF